jgi:hypothetical protein
VRTCPAALYTCSLRGVGLILGARLGDATQLLLINAANTCRTLRCIAERLLAAEPVSRAGDNHPGPGR